ncbi:S-adenosyl-L-methionine-dependent methyltransferase [Hypoxylon sp. FL1150]|nr:S-adenosyl-L-methionine-dependent methyltransferase [Hypoxylon sp. FL1150]
MEDKLAEALALSRGSRVLDAGCGVGHVALRRAKTHGLRIDAIDIVDHHVAMARRNAERSGLPQDPASTTSYDHNTLDSAPEDIAESMIKVNKYSAMPTNAISHPGVFKQMVEDAGFENIIIRDYSDNIRPMTRIFFLLAIIP